MQRSVEFNTIRKLNVFRTSTKLAALTTNDVIAALAAVAVDFLLLRSAHASWLSI